MDRRIGALIVVIVAASAVGLALRLDVPEAGAATVQIMVDGPAGVIWNGTVALEQATAFSALLAAAHEGGFEVAWSGSGDLLFVESVDGHHNAGAGGWCFAVWDDGWVHPPVSAGAWGLSEGDRLWWMYLPAGCP